MTSLELLCSGLILLDAHHAALAASNVPSTPAASSAAAISAAANRVASRNSEGLLACSQLSQLISSLGASKPTPLACTGEATSISWNRLNDCLVHLLVHAHECSTLMSCESFSSINFESNMEVNLALCKQKQNDQVNLIHRTTEMPRSLEMSSSQHSKVSCIRTWRCFWMENVKRRMSTFLGLWRWFNAGSLRTNELIQNHLKQMQGVATVQLLLDPGSNQVTSP